MAKKYFMKGNEAIGEAAIRAGVKAYYGYPITPQSELTAYMAANMEKLGRVFINTESEIASINAVYGTSCAGFRAMTSSASTAMSLKQEGISHLAYMEMPAVIVDMMRGGPGLGNILATQNDYNQAVKGGGTGDYHTIVVAPNSVQEAADLVRLAFDLADRYRNPALVLADGTIGQMVEQVEFPDPIDPDSFPEPPWALSGCEGRKPHKAEPKNSAADLEAHNIHLQEKYAECEKKERRSEAFYTEDADVLVVAFGLYSRIAREMVEELREEGLAVGLFRPITLWPYDVEGLLRAAEHAKYVVVTEGNAGMMCNDVRLFLHGTKPVFFHGRMGGSVMNSDDVKVKIRHLMEGNNDWRELDGKEGLWKTYES